MKFLLLAGIASLAISHAAQAAIITVSPATSGGSQINITGELERGDEIQFTEVAQNATQGIVNFNSPGGNTISAIAIGRLIRTYGFNTIVGNDATCTSACALAWLAGNVRYVTPDSRVGFHATYVKDNDGTPNITGGGNAMVGGYLQELGLSPSAIVALNSPGPNDIYWLQPADAAKLGIAAPALPESRDR